MLQTIGTYSTNCGGRRLGQMHKDNLLAAGTLHDVIPCDAHAFIDAQQSVTTLSALQAIPTLIPTPQLATASKCTGTLLGTTDVVCWWHQHTT
ncbi:unnamed protein product [Phytophthora fragariaefolia]|uniref:Unnamed protein product n=1 Tax=Phytophthora fragariaefolia TaxID=1490495 RepID=A0A9W6U3I4_9STRA|nr:unnamed protein product [Phytophthora fragariaefolia]